MIDDWWSSSWQMQTGESCGYATFALMWLMTKVDKWFTVLNCPLIVWCLLECHNLPLAPFREGLGVCVCRCINRNRCIEFLWKWIWFRNRAYFTCYTSSLLHGTIRDIWCRTATSSHILRYSHVINVPGASVLIRSSEQSLNCFHCPVMDLWAL